LVGVQGLALEKQYDIPLVGMRRIVKDLREKIW
jgi:hypothetical protein